MILAMVSVVIQQGRMDAALRLALEHTARARQAPGCLAHALQRDADNPNRLAFVEQWTDHALLNDYIASAEAEQFGAALAALCAEGPKVELYEANPVELY